MTTDIPESDDTFTEIVSPMVIERILFAEGTIPVFLDGDETVIGAAKFVKNAGGHMEITINCTNMVGERIAELMGEHLIGLAVVSRAAAEDKNHPQLDGFNEGENHG